MISIKQGCDVVDLRREVWIVIYMAAEVYRKYNTQLVITSAGDSKHSPGSFHYIGLAADIRIRNLPKKSDAKQVADEIRRIAGDNYDVILEKTHIHIEYDARRRRYENS